MSAGAGTAPSGAPGELGSGATITVGREWGDEITFREVEMHLDRNGDGGYMQDGYRVEYMGVTCPDVEIDRNEDGTWGEGHDGAVEACRKVASFLLTEANLKVAVGE